MFPVKNGFPRKFGKHQEKYEKQKKSPENLRSQGFLAEISGIKPLTS